MGFPLQSMHVDGSQDATRPVRRAFGRVVQSVRSGRRPKRSGPVVRPNVDRATNRRMGSAMQAQVKPLSRTETSARRTKALSLERRAAVRGAVAPHSCIEGEVEDRQTKKRRLSTVFA